MRLGFRYLALHEWQLQRGRGARRRVPERERGWAFTGSFAGSGSALLTGGDDTPRAELAETEAILGCSLPTALHDFYTLAGGMVLTFTRVIWTQLQPR